MVDVYGWVYQNGRDLSGFIDGTENAADDEQREEVAVENGSGGSYVVSGYIFPYVSYKYGIVVKFICLEH